MGAPPANGNILLSVLVFQFLAASMKENSNLILQKVPQVHYEARCPPTITTGTSLLWNGRHKKLKPSRKKGRCRGRCYQGRSWVSKFTESLGMAR